MVLAIIAGVLVGAAGFLPLIGGMNLAKKATPTSNLGHTAALLLGVFGSFAVIAIPMVICIAFFRDMAIPMVVAEAFALITVAIVYGIVRVVRR